MASRRRRGAPAAGARANGQTAEERIEAAARRLVKLFRQQAGIPVRMPAHAVPPFRAIPFNWAGVAQIEAADNSFVQRQFRINFSPILVTANGGGSAGGENDLNGPSNSYVAYSDSLAVDVGDATPFPGFPDGFVGWITHLDVAAWDSAGLNWLMHRYVRFTLKVNGASVPGFHQIPCNSTYQITAIGSMEPTAASPLLPIPCGIPLRAGNQVDVLISVGTNFVLGTTFRTDFVMRVGGYMIPTKSDDGTVYSTLGD